MSKPPWIKDLEKTVLIACEAVVLKIFLLQQSCFWNTQSDHLENFLAYVSEINLLYIYSKGKEKVIFSNENSLSVRPVSWSDASDCFPL